MANAFNDYFLNIANVLESRLPPCEGVQSPVIIQRLSSSFFVNYVAESNVVAMIADIKNSKNVNDCIPVSLLKKCSILLAPCIADLINFSFVL